MKKNSPIPLLICLAVAVLCACWIAGAEKRVSHALFNEGGAESDGARPPFSIAVSFAGEGEGAERAEYSITPVSVNGVWTVFLPGFAEAGNTELIYHGDARLCRDKGGPYWKKGERLPLDPGADGRYALYEYRADRGDYADCGLHIMRGGQIGSVLINLDVPSLPSLQMTDTEGEPLTDIIDWINASKENSTTAKMAVLDEAGRTAWMGSVDRLKARGNSSFREIENGKKSYSLRLDKSARLLDGAQKAKKWALVADREQTGLNEYCALQLFTALSENNAGARCDYVDLYIDGCYRGIYLLMERADNGGVIRLPDWHYTSRSEEKPTVVTDAENLSAYAYHAGAELMEAGGGFRTGGYLLEVVLGDTEDSWFRTKNGMKYRVKYPELCTEEQVLVIGSYVQDFEEAVLSSTGYNEKGEYYADYVDLDNLADFLLTYAYFSNQELMRTSTFLHVEVDRGVCGQIHFGPVWDFETYPDFFSFDLFDGMCFYSTPEQYLLPEALWTKGDFMQAALRRAGKVRELMGELLYGEDPSYDIETKCSEILPSLVMDLTNYAGRDEAYQELQRGSAEELLAGYVALLRKRQEIWEKLWDAEVYNFGDPVGKRDVRGKNNAFSKEAGGEVFSRESITVRAPRARDAR